MTELNPNHPTTQAVHDHWHKIAALIMHKLDLDHVVITPDDINQLMRANSSITMQELGDGIHLRIVDRVTAEKLARENGGLPN